MAQRRTSPSSHWFQTPRGWMAWDVGSYSWSYQLWSTYRWQSGGQDHITVTTEADIEGKEKKLKREKIEKSNQPLSPHYGWYA